MSNKVLMNSAVKAMARVSKGLKTLQTVLKELGKAPVGRGRKAAKGRKVAKVAKVVKVKKAKGRLGRKPGSKNKVKGTDVKVVPSSGKHLGRPFGSKNRSKVVSSPMEPSVVQMSRPVAPDPIFVMNPSHTDSYCPPPIT